MSLLATNWKNRLYPYVPLMVRRAKRVFFGWRWFRGHYATWEDAQVRAATYDQPRILKKVLHATLEVKAGRAAYERDSVLFHEPAVEAELLDCLRRVAANNGGRLRVLDFGGSLGTTYWQHRTELQLLTELRWDVVEQAHFVEAGRLHLQNDVLRFFKTIDEAEYECPHDILLASTVVQYVRDPHSLLTEFAARSFRYLVLHNLPLHDDESDYVTIEHVPPKIYPATYPAWFLNRVRFLAHFKSNYEVEKSYASTAIWDRGWYDYPSSGLMLRRITPELSA
jgi:putative methyltransferase (TIGR04325 family)